MQSKFGRIILVDMSQPMSQVPGMLVSKPAQNSPKNFGQISVADFREQIRVMKRAGEGLSVLGAPRPNPILVRSRKRKGGK